MADSPDLQASSKASPRSAVSKHFMQLVRGQRSNFRENGFLDGHVGSSIMTQRGLAQP